MPAHVIVGNSLKSFQEFPPSQKAGLTDVSAFLESTPVRGSRRVH
jgi:hypothetical protein